jgi:Tol biopolymer transport system component
MLRTTAAALLAVTGTLVLPAGSASASSAGGLAAASRVSVSSAEGQADDASFGAGLSADGRYVAFSSDATNLVRADTNRSRDVFVRDRRAGTTKRVSLSSTGGQGNEESFGTSITPDGRTVAFTSRASNLVKGDTAGQTDAFVRDVRTGRTTRVSVSSTGAQGNSESAFPQISANGRHVVFHSWATNLVTGDTTADAEDIFVRDLRTRTTERVSVSSTGAQADDYSFGVAISGNGRYVAFVSYATNLVPGDTNNAADVFLRDRRNRTTTRVNVGPGGEQADRASISVALTPDGRHVAFDSSATNLVSPGTPATAAVYVRDLRTGVTERIADGRHPALSADGTRVAYEAGTGTMSDVFVVDRRTGAVTAASTAADGGPADNFSSQPSLSGNGRLVGFRSAATNLMPGDTNGVDDSYVRPIR